MNSVKFQKIVYAHYKKYGRKLPWRFSMKNAQCRMSEFYRILVSEIMLQQTQVSRVVPKYKEFLEKFPNMQKLACASRRDVLGVWQGLGYNRRAIWLQEIAKELTHKPSSYNILIPTRSRVNKNKFRVEQLKRFRGIGPNTAASICAFAYNAPVVFIETNIRTVFLKYFFQHKKNVSDTDILKVVKKTLPKKNIREWYWALMDMGSYIKKVEGNINRTHSKHYVRQSRFEGSKRQLRGRILKEILKKDFLPQNKTERKIYEELIREGFVK